MKRFNQKTKVIILTFCLMIFLLNFHQLLKAEEECLYEPVFMCERMALEGCRDGCDNRGGCDYVEWLWGTCIYGGCFQTYDLWCDDGYLGDEQYECYPAGCPMK